MAKKDKQKQEVKDKEVVDTAEKETVNGAGEASGEQATEVSDAEKLADLNNKYLRLYSDFDNYRKRTIKEKADIIGSATSDLMKELLPIIDDFERAIANNENSEDLEGVKEGVKLIYNKTLNTLKSKGLEWIDSKGKAFDPEVHEAITNIPAPSEDMKGKVVDVIEKGYNLKGKPLRYAKVVVGQ